MKNKYFVLCFTLFTAFAADAQISRLVGLTKARYDGTAFGAIGDTSYYLYSGTKDTTHNGSLAYDTSGTLTYLPGYTAGNLSYRYIQSFIGTYNIDTELIQTYDTTSTSWINYQLQTGTWDASNNITQHIVFNWDAPTVSWIGSTKTDYTYAGMNTTLKINQGWNTISSAWINREKDSFAYDASSNMIYHLAQHWDTSSLIWVNNAQFLDTYNVSNQIITSLRQNWNPGSSIWVNNSLTRYHYNTIPMLCNTIVQHWDTSGTWHNFSMDSLTYTPGNDIAREITYRWDTSLIWMPQQMNANSYDAAHNMLTDTVRIWMPAGVGSFANRQLKLYSYNSYNQVLTYTTESWSPTTTSWFYKFTGGGGPDVQSRYYYEYVDTVDHTGISNVIANGGALVVAPNPSNTVLNIKLSWHEALPFSISIYDITGARLRHWNEPPMKNFTKTIAVNDLPAGNYILRATTQTSVQTTQFVILK